MSAKTSLGTPAAFGVPIAELMIEVIVPPVSVDVMPLPLPPETMSSAVPTTPSAPGSSLKVKAPSLIVLASSSLPKMPSGPAKLMAAGALTTRVPSPASVVALKPESPSSKTSMSKA